MDGTPDAPLSIGILSGARVDLAARVEVGSRFGKPTDAAEFNRERRYAPDALYNQALEFALRPGLALPLAYNFAPGQFLRMEGQAGGELPFYVEVPHRSSPGPYPWDSFPAGETAQFLITSVDPESLTGAREGRSGERIKLRAVSSSSAAAPFGTSS